MSQIEDGAPEKKKPVRRTTTLNFRSDQVKEYIAVLVLGLLLGMLL